MLETLIGSIITGAVALMGIIISNNKTVVILNERLEIYQERTDKELAAIRETINKHDELLDRVIILEVDQKSQWKVINELKEFHKPHGVQ